MALGKIKADTLEHSTAGSVDTQFVVNGSAKSWWQVDGTSTAHINDSFNTSALTDHGTGDYTITYSNNMGNVNYSAVGACGRDGGSYAGGDCEIPGPATPTVSAIRFYTYNYDATLVDVVHISGQICGDLA